MAAVADETRIEEGRRAPKRSGVLGMVNKYLQHTTKLRRMRYSSNERDSKWQREAAETTKHDG